MQSGGGVETDDTSTLNSVCGYAWCVFGKKNQGADSLPLSSSASIPGLPSHTLDLVRNSRVVRDAAWGGGGRGLCVKCLLEMHCGDFPVRETVDAKRSPFPVSISSG